MKRTALPAHWFASLLACFIFIATASADEEVFQQVEIADPYIELHTGPGAAYPIFHVVDRGEVVEILKRRTDWFKVRTDRGKEGWVAREQLELTLNPDGSQVGLAQFTRESFSQRSWEAGVMGGDFGGAAVISFYGAYHLTRNLSVELSVSQALGNFSDSVFIGAHIVNQPFPEWFISPYMTIGTGVIRTEPSATLVATEDRTDQILDAGFGVRTYISKRFLIRAEYKKYVAVTTRDDNDDIKEWKIGLSVFF